MPFCKHGRIPRIPYKYGILNTRTLALLLPLQPRLCLLLPHHALLLSTPCSLHYLFLLFPVLPSLLHAITADAATSTWKALQMLHPAARGKVGEA